MYTHTRVYLLCAYTINSEYVSMCVCVYRTNRKVYHIQTILRRHSFGRRYSPKFIHTMCVQYFPIVLSGPLNVYYLYRRSYTHTPSSQPASQSSLQGPSRIYRLRSDEQREHQLTVSDNIRTLNTLR